MVNKGLRERLDTLYDNVTLIDRKTVAIDKKIKKLENEKARIERVQRRNNALMYIIATINTIDSQYISSYIEKDYQFYKGDEDVYDITEEELNELENIVYLLNLATVSTYDDYIRSYNKRRGNQKVRQ